MQPPIFQLSNESPFSAAIESALRDTFASDENESGQAAYDTFRALFSYYGKPELPTVLRVSDDSGATPITSFSGEKLNCAAAIFLFFDFLSLLQKRGFVVTHYHNFAETFPNVICDHCYNYDDSCHPCANPYATDFYIYRA